MDLSTFYGWFGVNSSSLIDANKDNNMGDAAMIAWSNLSQWAILFFAGMVLLSFGLAFYYYREYNNQPKRHYTPKQWLLMGLGAIASVFVLTFICAFCLEKTDAINGLIALELKLSLCNSLYAAGIYFLVSFIWCNIPELPTNAYRCLKLKKQS